MGASLRQLAPLLIALGIGLAGCAAKPTSPPADPEVRGPRLGLDLVPVFRAPIIIDATRAGGEPVIAVTGKGTIMVSAHPGYTHIHPDASAGPPGGEAIVPTQGQSYMWRSTDDGKTFRSVSLLPVDAPNSGPRGVGQGVGDPDFAIDSLGRVYFTDLEALASASVSWSDDDGQTWLLGDNLASGGPNDRNWLATFGEKVYFRSNYEQPGKDVMVSEDRAGTWMDVGDSGCGGDIVANPLNGHLYVACYRSGQSFGGPRAVSVSSDGGKAWQRRDVPNASGEGPIEGEVAIDAGGWIHIASDPDRRDIVLSSSADDGVAWSTFSLKPFFPELADGTVLWPWTSAGSAGRVAVTFFGSPKSSATSVEGGEWFVYSAIVLGAGTPDPVVHPVKVTPKPMHVGPMCQSGTTCQATTAIRDASDRRLGDFFETTVDRTGRLHVVYADTRARPSDTVAHVGYSVLEEGPLLVEGELPPGFPTQG